MTTTTEGFLTADQLFRVNLKTMAQGGLPAPYGEGDIFGALLVTQQWYLTEGPEELTKAEAIQQAVNWYCTSDNDAIVQAFERFRGNEVFVAARTLVNLQHQYPEEFDQLLNETELEGDQ